MRLETILDSPARDRFPNSIRARRVAFAAHVVSGSRQRRLRVYMGKVGKMCARVSDCVRVRLCFARAASGEI